MLQHSILQLNRGNSPSKEDSTTATSLQSKIPMQQCCRRAKAYRAGIGSKDNKHSYGNSDIIAA